jgi:hypothetical protein
MSLVLNPLIKKQVDRALGELFSARLKPLGFEGKGLSYRRGGDGAVAFVKVQHWGKGTPAGQCNFAVNLGAYCERALEEDWIGLSIPEPSLELSQIRWRLGEDPRRGDRWFLVEDTASIPKVVEEVGTLLDREIGGLTALASPQAMLQFFESGLYGGQSELGRERVMQRLRDSLARSTGAKVR